MERRNFYFSTSGFTLIEALVALGIFSLLILAVGWIFITALRSNAIIWDQLGGQSDARRVLREVTDTARRAEISSLGAFPVEKADPYEFIFYANINTDFFRERVRFFVDQPNNILWKGITKPIDNPLRYPTSTEILTVVARDVVNDDLAIPLFTYFDEFYSGSSTAMAQPVSTTLVHVVNVDVEIDRDASAPPAPLRAASAVAIRSLKTN